MANQQYLFWAMAGALTLLITFVSVMVGKSQTPRKGVLTFIGLFVVLALLTLYVIY